MSRTGQHDARWRDLLDERLAEAIDALGAVPGVRGLIVGGSVGRGEPWPMSDIDLLPIYAVDARVEATAEVERRHGELIDWWAASGRAQTLDVGWLAFTEEEVEQAVSSDYAFAAERMSDRRWMHGMDKAYGGYGGADGVNLASAFAAWATSVRFHPRVTAARRAAWESQAVESRDEATDALARSDRKHATLSMRRAAVALRMVLVETWGERLGSMGREWTRFERMAAAHGGESLASRIADLAGASVAEAAARATLAPAWLKERIDLAYAARLAVDEAVTAEENARDQIAAFAVHVTRRRPEPWGEWVGVPDPALERKMAELGRVATKEIANRSLTSRPAVAARGG